LQQEGVLEKGRPKPPKRSGGNAPNEKSTSRVDEPRGFRHTPFEVRKARRFGPQVTNLSLARERPRSALDGASLRRQIQTRWGRLCRAFASGQLARLALCSARQKKRAAGAALKGFSRERASKGLGRLLNFKAPETPSISRTIDPDAAGRLSKQFGTVPVRLR